MTNLQLSVFSFFIYLLNHALSIPAIAYFAFGFFSVLLALIGRHLSGFSKPDAPYLSNVVKGVATPVSWMGITSIGLTLYLLTALVILADIGDASLFKLWGIIKSDVLTWLGGIIAGVIVGLPLIWLVIPKWASGEGLTDTERTLNQLRKLTTFDPLKYIDIGKGCFVGLKHASKKPIYVPWGKINESSMQCLGATGCGKNVEMLLIGYQCILAGQSVVWIDPKGDLRTPAVLLKAVESVGKKFHFINLNPNQPCQFNLLAGCSEHDIEELFVSGFDLRNQGGDGDFHRGRDEDAAMLAAKLAIKEQANSIPELLQLCANISAITDQENFWRKFRKLASLPVIQTAKGLDLEAAVLNGDVIYIVGSCDNERVKMLQKMLLVHMMQIIKKRDRFADNKPVSVVLDEYKNLLSPTALNALAVVRDFNAHFLLAHQSIGDLDEAANVSYASAYGAVVNNTALKVIFKISDTAFAKQIAELAGTKKVFKENTSKSSSQVNGQVKSNGAWIEDRDYRIPAEVITGLPMPKDRKNQAVVGVLHGVADTQLFYSSYIKVDPVQMSVVTAEPFTVNTVSNNVGDLI